MVGTGSNLSEFNCCVWYSDIIIWNILKNLAPWVINSPDYCYNDSTNIHDSLLLFLPVNNVQRRLLEHFPHSVRTQSAQLVQGIGVILIVVSTIVRRLNKIFQRFHNIHIRRLFKRYRQQLSHFCDWRAKW